MLGHTDVRFCRFRSSFRGCTDNLGSETSKHINLLIGHLLRKSNDHLVTLNSSGKGESDASVARSCLNDNVAFLEAAVLFSINNHSPANTVLNQQSCYLD